MRALHGSVPIDVPCMQSSVLCSIAHESSRSNSRSCRSAHFWVILPIFDASGARGAASPRKCLHCWKPFLAHIYLIVCWHYLAMHVHWGRRSSMDSPSTETRFCHQTWELARENGAQWPHRFLPNHTKSKRECVNIYSMRKWSLAPAHFRRCNSS